MENIEKIYSETNYTVINIGKLDDLFDRSYQLPGSDQKMKGKIFLGEMLSSTGTEISFQSMPPKAEIPFSHTHTENEETYIFLKGNGEMELDGNKIAITEGSIIRVAPKTKRTWRNTSDDQHLILIVIQSKAGSLTHFYGSDGKLEE